MDRQTIKDIAQAAGVSTATVDRALNDRAGVRSITKARVFSAARSIGYLDEPGELEGSQRFTNQVDLVLPEGRNTYIRNLKEHFQRLCDAEGSLSLNLHLIRGFQPASLAETLLALGGKTKAVALIGPDHPLVRESIRHLVSEGTRVVTLASDINNAPRTAFSGIDNRAAGRLAGLLMARLVPETRPKHALLMAGSLSYRAHEERLMGCRSILSEDYPGFQITESFEVKDDADVAYDACLKCLIEYPAISAIYSVGAGNRGVAEAVRERGRDRDIVVIAHELTRFSKSFLLDGTFDVVLDQNPEKQAQDSIHVLTARELQDIPLQRPGIIFKENL